MSNRGFNLRGNTVVVYVDLKKFYSNFKSGAWSGSAIANVDFNIAVKHDASVKYRKSITGKFTKTGIMGATGANAAIALDGALNDAMMKLFQNRSFIDSILKAGAPKKINNTNQSSGERGGIF